MNKRFYVALLAILLISIAVAPVANAALQSRMCTVKQVETNSSGQVVATFAPTGYAYTRYFLAPSGDEKTMLAVLLTAMTQGLTVEVRADWGLNGSDIAYVRLISQ